MRLSEFTNPNDYSLPNIGAKNSSKITVKIWPNSANENAKTSSTTKSKTKKPQGWLRR
jgi:hypothetical protein